MGLITYIEYVVYARSGFSPELDNFFDMVKLKEQGVYFMQLYVSFNMGNGCMELYTFEKDSRKAGSFDVLDWNLEDMNYWGLKELLGLTEYNRISFIFNSGDDMGMLYPTYEDINEDGYDDITFTGF